MKYQNQRGGRIVLQDIKVSRKSAITNLGIWEETGIVVRHVFKLKSCNSDALPLIYNRFIVLC